MIIQKVSPQAIAKKVFTIKRINIREKESIEIPTQKFIIQNVGDIDILMCLNEINDNYWTIKAGDKTPVFSLNSNIILFFIPAKNAIRDNGILEIIFWN